MGREPGDNFQEYFKHQNLALVSVPPAILVIAWYYERWLWNPNSKLQNTDV